MAPLFLATKQAVTGGFSPTALPCVFQSSANHEHQQGGAILGVARRLSHSRFINPADLHVSSLMAGTLPGSAIRRSSRPFIHAVRLPAGLVLSRPGQLRSQCVAGFRVIHLSKRLSSSPSFDGFKTNRKALTCEAQPLSSDDKIHD